MCDEPAATSDVACQTTIDKQPQIISRAEAKAAGLKRYFSGTACLKHHICERQVSNRTCFQCSYERIERWTAKNRDKVNAKAKKWARKHPEKSREASRKWRINNYNKSREMCRTWHSKNPAKLRLYASRRRAKLSGSAGSYTVEQIQDLFKKQKGKCVGCLCSIKRGWHDDHILALSKGGSNYITNIQLLCQPCNQRKHAKDPIIWAQENGRLL